MAPINKLIAAIAGTLVLLVSAFPARAEQTPPPPPALPEAPHSLYIPFAANPSPSASSQRLRVNAPSFSDGIPFAQTAIFWLGKVNSNESYADVRVGYNSQELFVHVAVFDRYLWHDTTPDAASLTAWDAIRLYLDLDGGQGGLSPHSYRLTGQLSWSEGRTSYQLAEAGGAAGWQGSGLSFTTKVEWRGDDMDNNTGNDRGWSLQYRIPFSSLGLSGAPAEGSLWGLGVEVFDRDDRAGTAQPVQVWPPAFDQKQPESWGELRFGIPDPRAASVAEAGSTIIRNGRDGVRVVDGEVGGSTTCGYDQKYWQEWGTTPNPGSKTNADMNIQNQFDVGDWPCFGKFYITFPLDSVPPGKTITSAQLSLHQFGNSGGGVWGDPPDSYIQVLSVGDDWDEATLTWNGAPLAVENISGAWVSGLAKFPGWPGVERIWEVGRAVAQAYAAGQPLRLVIYSADGDYHSGKYFSTSDTPEWNWAARPGLKVNWGNP